MSFSQDKYKDKENDGKESPTSFDVPPFESLNFDKSTQIYKHDEVTKIIHSTKCTFIIIISSIINIGLNIGAFFAERNSGARDLLLHSQGINIIISFFFLFPKYWSIPCAAMNAAMTKALINYDIKDVPLSSNTKVRSLSMQDWRRLFLLMLLYMTQSLPFGITYSNAAFSFTTSEFGYPYQQKMLFMVFFLSPVIETKYFSKIGKRKSWIVGTQFIIACMLIFVGWKINNWGDKNESFIFIFILLLIMLLGKVQDLVIQGWAISILGKNAVGYSYVIQKMCVQFSIFLTMIVCKMADSNPTIITRGFYVLSIGLLNLLVAGIALIFIPENLPVDYVNEEEDVKSGWINKKTLAGKLNLYKSINFQKFMLLQALTCFSFEAINFDSDLPKSGFSILFLLDIYAVCWSNSGSPVRLWRFQYWIGIVYALFKHAFVWLFPKSEGVGTTFVIGSLILPILELICFNLRETITHTFYLKLADPLIGSLDLIVMLFIEAVIKEICHDLVSKLSSGISKIVCIDLLNSETNPFVNEEFYYCSSKEMTTLCNENGGTCAVIRNGYFYVNALCITVGLTLYLKWGRPNCKYLEKIPLSYWREQKLN